MRRKQVRVCSVALSADCVPPEGESLLDPTALEPFAHTSPWEWLTPLVLAPAAALALATAGSCSAGSCHGAWLLPARAAEMGLGAAQAKGAPVVLPRGAYHPSRAGGLAGTAGGQPPEIRAAYYSMIRKRGSKKTPSQLRHLSTAMACMLTPKLELLSLPHSRGCCAHPQPCPQFWLAPVKLVLCLPARMSPLCPWPPEPGHLARQLLREGAWPSCVCTPWTFYSL